MNCYKTGFSNRRKRGPEGLSEEIKLVTQEQEPDKKALTPSVLEWNKREEWGYQR